jgi:maltose/moltooligosaccharide transporter
MPDTLHDQSPSGPRTYTVGTLVYTRAALIQVFVWLLLGDFCLHLMDNGVIPTLVPLQFESAGLSKTAYNFYAFTVVNIVYAILVPIVSVWSDRTRTGMGRRRPFLLFTAPVLAVSLVLLGFSTQIGRALHATFPSLEGLLSLPALIGGLTIGFFLLFKLMDLFPQSVYYYLWPDVIPPQFMGVFGALFRVFYAAGSLTFNYFLIQHARDNPQLIYSLAAGLYLIAFLLLAWRVKEPDYPPPDVGAKQSVPQIVVGYVRDCYATPFYLKFFIMAAIFQAGYQPFVGNLIYFGREIFGDSESGLKSYGSVMVWKDFIWIGIYLALVPIMIKLHPLRAAILGFALMLITAVAGAGLIHGPASFRTMVVLTFAAVAMYLGGTAAIGARLLPMEKYGQFASAGALIFRLTVAVAGIPVGFLLEQTNNGRVLFAWFGGCCLVGLALAISLYRDWQRLGGDEGYQPPRPWQFVRENDPRGFDVLPPKP